MLQQRWKAENYGFVYTKHYFSEFWGAGLRRFGQLFSSFFLRRVWRRYFTIFWEFEGPAVPPKTTFGEHFRYTFYVDFLWIFNGKPDLKQGKGCRRLAESGTLKHWFTDHWKLTSDQKPHKDKQKKTERKTDSWNTKQKLIAERKPKPRSAAWWPL